MQGDYLAIPQHADPSAFPWQDRKPALRSNLYETDTSPRMGRVYGHVVKEYDPFPGAAIHGLAFLQRMPHRQSLCRSSNIGTYLIPGLRPIDVHPMLHR